ncbi:hypothetical protein ACTWPT_18565 [Nonomuraea sp. 3N208]|uniref:hypothetical protein n=1 Tax=Nonomuraea sp. 3N208 TaxID=3457421 RepID=UPI003FCD2BCA
MTFATQPFQTQQYGQQIPPHLQQQYGQQIPPHLQQQYGQQIPPHLQQQYGQQGMAPMGLGGMQGGIPGGPQASQPQPFQVAGEQIFPQEHQMSPVTFWDKIARCGLRYGPGVVRQILTTIEQQQMQQPFGQQMPQPQQQFGQQLPQQQYGQQLPQQPFGQQMPQQYGQQLPIGLQGQMIPQQMQPTGVPGQMVSQQQPAFAGIGQ